MRWIANPSRYSTPSITTTHNPHRATGHPNWRFQSIMLLLFYSIPSGVKVIIDFVPLLHLCNCCAHKFAIGERHITINLPYHLINLPTSKSLLLFIDTIITTFKSSSVYYLITTLYCQIEMNGLQYILQYIRE